MSWAWWVVRLVCRVKKAGKWYSRGKAKSLDDGELAAGMGGDWEVILEKARMIWKNGWYTAVDGRGRDGLMVTGM